MATNALTVRELIAAGTIGAPLAVDLQWVLDTSHGADYFRRWHAEKDKSGAERRIDRRDLLSHREIGGLFGNGRAGLGARSVGHRAHPLYRGRTRPI